MLFALALALSLFASHAHAQPRRVVSLDFCADQYLLRLADRDQIAAVSRYAEGEDSYERARATGLPQIRPTLEEIAPLRPDLVLRSFGGGPTLEPALARRGIAVMQVGWVDDVAGIAPEVRRVGAALGQAARAEAFARSLDERRARLAAIRVSGASALYLTPGAVAAGRGTMVQSIFDAAGVRNIETQAGWRPAPLERLLRDPPERLVLSFFSFAANRQDAWSGARHPSLRRLIAETPHIEWPAAWTACPTWGALDAAEALQRSLARD